MIEMTENGWKIMKLKLISRCYTSISDGLVHMGNESHNNTVKTEYSYRERLDMGEFVETVELVTTEMSRVDDSVLFGSR